ncbi:hypothetical protein LXL04_020248 [Taraxacum kok-saghyz]
MEASDVELVVVDKSGCIQSLLLSLDNQEGPGNQDRRSISMVPSAYRDLSPSSFDPRVVSIGPLHKQDEHLQGFEAQKLNYLYDLLNRVDPRQESKIATLEECVQKVSNSIEQIKECYDGMKTSNDHALVTMMVTDACFILDLIFYLPKSGRPLWKNTLIIQPIIFDLLMIENQIPLFVLEDIFKCTVLKFEPQKSLTEYVLPLLELYNVFEEKLEVSKVNSHSPDSPPNHILGLLHKFYQPETTERSREFTSVPKGHSVVELDRAGLNFCHNQDKKWAMAIELKLPWMSFFPWFCCKPTLGMPILLIDDFTELILRNLIVYELSFLAQNCVTSYACAMDMLIDTSEDVAKLVKSKVLINNLGSNENVANMMNNICKEVPAIDFLYDEEWTKLDTYYHGCLANLAAELNRTYFSSPWSCIALFGAFVLFALTLVQTIFSIKAA